MDVRSARDHNIFGPEGSWNGRKEKAPAAICRKVAMASDGGEIEIMGRRRTDSIERTLQLTRSDVTGPVNIGSDEMVTINKLVDIGSCLRR
jgi:hypothetical protein